MKKIYSFLMASLFSVMLLSATPTTGLVFSGATGTYADLGSTATAPAEFTIETWVCYKSFPTGESAYILSTEEDNAGSKGFSLRSNKNKVNLCIGNGGWVNVVGATALNPATWYHIAATCSATEIKVYVNGVLDATAPLSTPMVPSSKNLRFGDSPSWTGRLLNGYLSDLRFWSVARSQAEIAADMTNTLTGSETGLVAGWKMNEGAGTTVADIKGTSPLTIGTNISWYIPVTGITVSGNAITTDGGTSQMSLTVLPATATQSVVWTVSNPLIATINADGLLTARKNGNVTVTATAKDGSNVTGTAQIAVSNQITPTKQVFIDLGLSTGTTPAGADAYGNFWNNASDPASTAAAVALVDNTNVASGFSLSVTTTFSGANGPTAGGLTTPIASYLGEFAIPTATQDYFYATASALKITGLNVNKGYRFKLFGSRDNTETRKSQFVFTGSNSLTTPEYQTSGTGIGGEAGLNGNNSNILRTDVVYPTAAGEITIAVNKTAGSFAHLNIMKIEEFDKVAVSSITVSGNAISTVGGTSQMIATVLPANAALKDVVWSVNNPGIATISSTGLLTANNNGTITVTAASKDGSNVSGSAQIVVSGQPTPVKQVYIDFGPDGGTSGFATTNPDSNNNYWNTVINATAAAGSVALIDNSGNPSGFSMVTLVDFTVNANNGVMGLATPSATLLGEFAIPSATKDFFFLDNTTTRSLKITGLNVNKGYKFYAYGCRVATDTRVSKYTFIGSTTVSGTQQTTGANLGGTGVNGNNSNVFCTPIMSPDANGEVKFELGFVTGMAYINIMKIEETNINVASISVTGAAITTNAGTSQMTATVLPTNATVKTVTWSVDNTDVATIDANGLLTAKSNGTVNVTATTTEAGSTVSNTIAVAVSGQTATGLSNQTADVKVFPVVFDNQVSVKGATNVVELFNSTGVKVLSQAATSEILINTSKLSKGVYLLVVDKKQSYKLIK